MERQEKYRMSNKRVKIEKRLLCNYLDIWRRSLETEHDTRQTKALPVFARFLSCQNLVKKKGEKRTDKEYDRLWIYL